MKQVLYLKSGDRRAGICSYVMQVIMMAKVCKEQNIPMYVDFSEHMLYYKDNQTSDNVWEYFFEQPFKDNLQEYERIEAVWYQDARPLYFEYRYSSDSSFLKTARSYCREFVHLKPELLQAGDNFIKNNSNGKYLAVHKRGCDHANLPFFTIKEYLTETDKYIDNYEQLLVCSDEEFSVKEFQKRYGSKVISYNSIRETDPVAAAQGAHFKDNSNNFVYYNGRDCIIEAYLMSQADFLLKTVSNVSHFATMLSDNLDFIWIDENYKCFY